MSSQQNWNEIGNRLKEEVQGALTSGDFEGVHHIVSESVTSALSEAKRQLGQIYGGRAGKQAGDQAKALPVIRTKKVGKVAGILLMVFGGIGAGLSAVAVLVTFIIFLTGETVVPLSLAGLLLAAFIFMIQRGAMRRDRIKRAERYVELCGARSYIDIEELALHMGKSKRYIRKDVKKMIRLGIFPEGHLDAQESCLILNDATFREYLRLQKERKVLEMEEKVARMQRKQKASGAYPAQEDKTGVQIRAEEAFQAGREQDTPEQSDDPELTFLIKEGNDCIRRLKDMNDAIEGEVISAKLFRLEELLKEIFDRVKEHPEQMPQMRKFMDYYLPTTLKLVEAYGEFDEVSVPGEDITSAKLEIEKTLDTINQAFGELLNKLFRSAVFDVTTDAQVLKTMLASEGLTGDGEFVRITRQ